MPAVIPFIPSNGNYDFDVDIDGASYHFDVRWNSRDEVPATASREGVDGAWYFDISESDGTPIARGLKITVGSYIGRYSTHELFEKGVIAAIDTSGAYRDPGFDDLGTRVEVRYYTVEDLVAEVTGS